MAEERASGDDSRAFVRSAITSAVATASDFVVASALVTLSVSAALGTFLGCFVGGLVAFWVNRGWAFRSEGRAGTELLRFFGVWAASTLLNPAGVSLVTRFGIPFAPGWMAVRGLVYAGWNYPMMRWFVFPRVPRVSRLDP